MADYHEDLRAFYVACTRAADYLILSAALEDNFLPKTPWMLALGERFNLQSGECLVPDIEPERVPKVRVIRDLPAVSGPLQIENAKVPQQPDEELIEIILREKESAQLREEVDNSNDLQWDTEDGSDRCVWKPKN